MPLRRFEEVLEFNALYFSNLSTLADKFEGTFPLDPISGLQIWTPPATGSDGQPDALHEITLPIAAEFARHDFHANTRKELFINCWTLRTSESTAMWQVYSRSEPGIAIRSQIGRLKDSFAAEANQVMIGEVTYVDLSLPVSQPDIPDPVITKHIPFDWEKEVRCIRYVPRKDGQPPPKTIPTGLMTKIDTELLIEAVVIQPSAKDDLLDFVRRRVTQYGLSEELVSRSSLDQNSRYY